MQPRTIANRMSEVRTVDHIHHLLRTIQDVCSLQEGLFDETFKAISLATKKRKNAEELTKQGSWGFHREREATEQETCFGISTTTKSVEFDEKAAQFNASTRTFINALDEKINGGSVFDKMKENETPSRAVIIDSLVNDAAAENENDLESIRFLASQLNYNVFYDAGNF
jgi:hypothetical protein